MHTELTLSRAGGGAVSVQLKSWPSRVFLKAASQQAIERNLATLKELCAVKSAQLPPPFELQYLATVMCQFTGDTTRMFGDTTRMFDRVKCFESKAHVYWSFELREPFVSHQELSADNAIYITLFMVQTRQELKE